MDEFIEFPRFSDSRGCLSVIEGGKQVPFDIARIYYIYDVPADKRRAGHAHYRLTELLVAVAGCFDVTLDNGFDKTAFHLNCPYRGLLLRPMTWLTIDNFSWGGVCLALASLPYDETDYISDYDLYLRIRRESA